MSLNILWTDDERLAGADVTRVLTSALSSCAGATLFVPSFAQQQLAARQVARHPDLSLGVTVTTLLAWAEERWGIWGDGRGLVDEAARCLLTREVLSSAPDELRGGLGTNPGTRRLVGELASRALPWMSPAKGGELDDAYVCELGLTGGEKAALRLVGRYAQRLHDHGLIERSELLCGVADALREAGVVVAPVVVSGFTSMDRAERELLAGLAGLCEVTVAFGRKNAELLAGCEELAESLRALAADRGAQREDPGTRHDGSQGAVPSATAGVRQGGEMGLVPSVPADATPADATPADAAPSLVRDPELEELLGRLFLASGKRVVARGSVSLLEAAGPHAEAELVARKLDELACKGITSVVVVAPDVERAWRELAPKLEARGVSVTAELPCAFPKTDEGRAFLEFAQGVAQLATLAETWPPSQASAEGELVRLGDMGWWPPRGLADFLLSGISCVPTTQAYRLDRRWRQDRLLTPTDVLRDLQSPKMTSLPVAQATRELLKGRLASAASKLLGPLLGRTEPGLQDFVQDDRGRRTQELARAKEALFDARATAVLALVLKVAATLRSLGAVVDPKRGGTVTLAGLVAQATDALSDALVSLRPTLEVAGATCKVRILSARAAAQLEPASVDAVVLMGQSSDESLVGTGDDVLSALLVLLGVERDSDPLPQLRSAFLSTLAAARSYVVLERSLLDRSLRQRWPSVMLTELRSCYEGGGAGKDGLPVERLDEAEADANCAPSGRPSTRVGQEALGQPGAVSPSLRGLVVVPPEGRAELLDGRPLLSASQLESYLECPYKWFSLRRLGLQNSDADLTSLEMGTFAHRVLEVTHRTMLDQARERLLRERGRAANTQLPLTERIEGSRVGEGDSEGLERARRILSDEFDLHLEHQYLRQGKGSRAQVCVPHDDEERGQLEQLRQDLLSTLDYESGLFLGFEPRLFEWSFGRGEAPVEYAGAYLVGTVDRVDVDAHGLAIVIDYKHRSPTVFSREYGIPTLASLGGFVLPRRVQSLVYGQVVRRRHPDLRVVATVYLSSKGRHAVFGAVSRNVSDRVFGSHPVDPRQLPLTQVDDACDFGVAGSSRGMEALLDATEEAIAEKVEQLLAGHVEADPIDAAACHYCPVMNCDMRRSRWAR